MTAFHTIAIPHDDILQGRLTMDVFAADLWDVYKDRGSDIFNRVTQALSKTQKLRSKEEKILGGHIAGRKHLQEEAEMIAKQGGLFA